MLPLWYQMEVKVTKLVMYEQCLCNTLVYGMRNVLLYDVRLIMTRVGMTELVICKHQHGIYFQPMCTGYILLEGLDSKLELEGLFADIHVKSRAITKSGWMDNQPVSTF